MRLILLLIIVYPVEFLIFSLIATPYDILKTKMNCIHD